MFRFTKLASLVAALVVATPALAGPPWIKIELGGNPYDRDTRDAFLVVHAFHHGTPTAFPVTGTAEGVVNGERRTIPLTLTKTSREGAFALAKQWPAKGRWVLALSVTQARDDAVTAIVRLAATGEFESFKVLTRHGENGMLFPRALTKQDIADALK
jgi:hypothetical protein